MSDIDNGQLMLSYVDNDWFPLLTQPLGFLEDSDPDIIDLSSSDYEDSDYELTEKVSNKKDTPITDAGLKVIDGPVDASSNKNKTDIEISRNISPSQDMGDLDRHFDGDVRSIKVNEIDKLPVEKALKRHNNTDQLEELNVFIPQSTQKINNFPSERTSTTSLSNLLSQNPSNTGDKSIFGKINNFFNIFTKQHDEPEIPDTTSQQPAPEQSQQPASVPNDKTYDQSKPINEIISGIYTEEISKNCASTTKVRSADKSKLPEPQLQPLSEDSTVNTSSLEFKSQPEPFNPDILQNFQHNKSQPLSTSKEISDSTISSQSQSQSDNPRLKLHVQDLPAAANKQRNHDQFTEKPTPGPSEYIIQNQPDEKSISKKVRKLVDSSDDEQSDYDNGDKEEEEANITTMSTETKQLSNSRLKTISAAKLKKFTLPAQFATEKVSLVNHFNETLTGTLLDGDTNHTAKGLVTDNSGIEVQQNNQNVLESFEGEENVTNKVDRVLPELSEPRVIGDLIKKEKKEKKGRKSFGNISFVASDADSEAETEHESSLAGNSVSDLENDSQSNSDSDLEVKQEKIDTEVVNAVVSSPQMNNDINNVKEETHENTDVVIGNTVDINIGNLVDYDSYKNFEDSANDIPKNDVENVHSVAIVPIVAESQQITDPPEFDTGFEYHSDTNVEIHTQKSLSPVPEAQLGPFTHINTNIMSPNDDLNESQPTTVHPTAQDQPDNNSDTSEISDISDVSSGCNSILGDNETSNNQHNIRKNSVVKYRDSEENHSNDLDAFEKMIAEGEFDSGSGSGSDSDSDSGLSSSSSLDSDSQKNLHAESNENYNEKADVWHEPGTKWNFDFKKSSYNITDIPRSIGVTNKFNRVVSELEEFEKELANGEFDSDVESNSDIDKEKSSTSNLGTRVRSRSSSAAVSSKLTNLSRETEFEEFEKSLATGEFDSDKSSESESESESKSESESGINYPHYDPDEQRIKKYYGFESPKTHVYQPYFLRNVDFIRKKKESKTDRSSNFIHQYIPNKNRGRGSTHDHLTNNRYSLPRDTNAKDDSHLFVTEDADSGSDSDANVSKYTNRRATLKKSGKVNGVLKGMKYEDIKKEEFELEYIFGTSSAESKENRKNKRFRESGYVYNENSFDNARTYKRRNMASSNSSVNNEIGAKNNSVYINLDSEQFDSDD